MTAVYYSIPGTDDKLEFGQETLSTMLRHHRNQADKGVDKLPTFLCLFAS
jgi:hypothetical protein